MLIKDVKLCYVNAASLLRTISISLSKLEDAKEDEISGI